MSANSVGSPSAHSAMESLYRTVLDSLTEEVAIVSRYGDVIDSNRAWRAADAGHRVLGRRMAAASNYVHGIRRAAERHAEAAVMLEGIERVLAAQELRFDYEYTCLRDGHQRWFAMRVTALQRPEGGLVVIHYDITDRRLAERDRDVHLAELGRTGRAALLGQLSGAIAHELNQPLTAILANAQVGIHTAERTGADTELCAILRDIEHDTKRAGKVIKHVRDLLKRRESDYEPIELNGVVQDVLSFSRSDVLVRGISVSMGLDRALPLVRGDAIQLQQLLLNLVMNACEAMTSVERAKRALHISTKARADGWIRLAVRDSGPGFGVVERDKVLQPFYTTKEKGLGLGLTICHSIVQAHGGTMKLAKSKQSGARVTVDLPAFWVEERYGARRAESRAAAAK